MNNLNTNAMYNRYSNILVEKIKTNKNNKLISYINIKDMSFNLINLTEQILEYINNLKCYNYICYICETLHFIQLIFIIFFSYNSENTKIYNAANYILLYVFFENNNVSILSFLIVNLTYFLLLFYLLIYTFVFKPYLNKTFTKITNYLIIVYFTLNRSFSFLYEININIIVLYCSDKLYVTNLNKYSSINNKVIDMCNNNVIFLVKFINCFNILFMMIISFSFKYYFNDNNFSRNSFIWSGSKSTGRIKIINDIFFIVFYIIALNLINAKNYNKEFIIVNNNNDFNFKNTYVLKLLTYLIFIIYNCFNDINPSSYYYINKVYERYYTFKNGFIIFFILNLIICESLDITKMNTMYFIFFNILIALSLGFIYCRFMHYKKLYSFVNCFSYLTCLDNESQRYTYYKNCIYNNIFKLKFFNNGQNYVNYILNNIYFLKLVSLSNCSNKVYKKYLISFISNHILYCKSDVKLNNSACFCLNLRNKYIFDNISINKDTRKSLTNINSIKFSNDLSCIDDLLLDIVLNIIDLFIDNSSINYLKNVHSAKLKVKKLKDNMYNKNNSHYNIKSNLSLITYDLENNNNEPFKLKLDKFNKSNNKTILSGNIQNKSIELFNKNIDNSKHMHNINNKNSESKHLIEKYVDKFTHIEIRNEIINIQFYLNFMLTLIKSNILLNTTKSPFLSLYEINKNKKYINYLKSSKANKIIAEISKTNYLNKLFNKNTVLLGNIELIWLSMIEKKINYNSLKKIKQNSSKTDFNNFNKIIESDYLLHKMINLIKLTSNSIKTLFNELKVFKYLNYNDVEKILSFNNNKLNKDLDININSYNKIKNFNKYDYVKSNNKKLKKTRFLNKLITEYNICKIENTISIISENHVQIKNLYLSLEKLRCLDCYLYKIYGYYLKELWIFDEDSSFYLDKAILLIKSKTLNNKDININIVSDFDNLGAVVINTATTVDNYLNNKINSILYLNKCESNKEIFKSYYNNHYYKLRYYVNKNISQINKDVAYNNDFYNIISTKSFNYINGKIVYFNNELINLTKYNQNELMGSNIKNLMPYMISNIHDDLVSNLFLDDSNYLDICNNTYNNKKYNPSKKTFLSVLNNQRSIFIKDKEDNIIPASMYISIFPSITSGLLFTSYIRKSEVFNNCINIKNGFKYAHIITDNNNKLVYYDYNAKNHFNFDDYFKYNSFKNNKEIFDINKMFPELLFPTKQLEVMEKVYPLIVNYQAIKNYIKNEIEHNYDINKNIKGKIILPYNSKNKINSNSICTIKTIKFDNNIMQKNINNNSNNVNELISRTSSKRSKSNIYNNINKRSYTINTDCNKAKKTINIKECANVICTQRNYDNYGVKYRIYCIELEDENSTSLNKNNNTTQSISDDVVDEIASVFSMASTSSFAKKRDPTYKSLININKNVSKTKMPVILKLAIIIFIISNALIILLLLIKNVIIINNDSNIRYMVEYKPLIDFHKLYFYSCVMFYISSILLKSNDNSNIKYSNVKNFISNFSLENNINSLIEFSNYNLSNNRYKISSSNVYYKDIVNNNFLYLNESLQYVSNNKDILIGGNLDILNSVNNKSYNYTYYIKDDEYILSELKGIQIIKKIIEEIHLQLKSLNELKSKINMLDIVLKKEKSKLATSNIKYINSTNLNGILDEFKLKHNSIIVTFNQFINYFYDDIYKAVDKKLNDLFVYDNNTNTYFYLFILFYIIVIYMLTTLYYIKLIYIRYIIVNFIAKLDDSYSNIMINKCIDVTNNINNVFNSDLFFTNINKELIDNYKSNAKKRRLLAKNNTTKKSFEDTNNTETSRNISSNNNNKYIRKNALMKNKVNKNKFNRQKRKLFNIKNVLNKKVNNNISESYNSINQDSSNRNSQMYNSNITKIIENSHDIQNKVENVSSSISLFNKSNNLSERSTLGLISKQTLKNNLNRFSKFKNKTNLLSKEIKEIKETNQENIKTISTPKDINNKINKLQLNSVIDNNSIINSTKSICSSMHKSILKGLNDIDNNIEDKYYDYNYIKESISINDYNNFVNKSNTTIDNLEKSNFDNNISTDNRNLLINKDRKINIISISNSKVLFLSNLLNEKKQHILEYRIKSIKLIKRSMYYNAVLNTIFTIFIVFLSVDFYFKISSNNNYNTIYNYNNKYNSQITFNYNYLFKTTYYILLELYIDNKNYSNTIEIFSNFTNNSFFVNNYNNKQYSYIEDNINNKLLTNTNLSSKEYNFCDFYNTINKTNNQSNLNIFYKNCFNSAYQYSFDYGSFQNNLILQKKINNEFNIFNYNKTVNKSSMLDRELKINQYNDYLYFKRMEFLIRNSEYITYSNAIITKLELKFYELLAYFTKYFIDSYSLNKKIFIVVLSISMLVYLILVSFVFYKYYIIPNYKLISNSKISLLLLPEDQIKINKDCQYLIDL